MNIHIYQGRIPETYPLESRVLSLLEIRKQASDEIERLLAIMDEIDGDPDLEPTAGNDSDELRDECEDSSAECEPVLGATEAMNQQFAWAQTYGILDAEEQCEDEAADDDREDDPAAMGIGDQDGLAEQVTGEPSLGSLDSAVDQDIGWQASTEWIVDGELDHDGREPEEDKGVGEDEPKFPPLKNLVRNLSISPEMLPQLYSMRVDGGCLEPIVWDGERVRFDKSLPCRPGDLVGLYFRKDVVPRGGHQMLLKRLIIDGREGAFRLMDGRFAVMVEMLNPHRTLVYPAEIIIAMHRCTGVKNAAECGPTASEGDLMVTAALARRQAATAS